MGFFDTIDPFGLTDDLFGKPGGTSSVPQTEDAKKARKRLADLGFGPPPEVPLRGVAEPGPLGPERKLARETATELAQPVDIFSLPEVQGIIQETVNKGNLLANRLGRSLQASGTFTSTPGRDVLGRAVTDVQKSLAASLSTFAESERSRRRSLIPILEQLGLTEELRAQGFSQAELDALFQKETTESRQLQTFTIPLLQSIIGQQPGLILEPREPGIIEQLGPLLQAAAVASASDSRLKKDIKTIENAMEKLEQLDGKTFKFKDGTESGGVIAQDVEKVMPEIVGERDGFKTVDYNALIGLLINAVNELARKVG